MSHKNTVIYVSFAFFMFVCLFFQKGYDESEHSTFSATNYKNNGQTVFFSLFDFCSIIAT